MGGSGEGKHTCSSHVFCYEKNGWDFFCSATRKQYFLYYRMKGLIKIKGDI